MIADPHKLGNPDAFDALADLFLGQMNAVQAHDAALGATPRTRSGADRTALHAPSREVSSSHKLTLADVRPTHDADCDRKLPPVEVPPRIEALVLGHLPVMASAWAAQYARHVADRIQKPVAAIRLAGGGGDHVRIELHTPAGSGNAGPRAATNIIAAVEAVRKHAARIILMTDTGREPELAQTAGIDRVTLLTSGDEAGIVAAYGLIKTLAQRLKAAHGPGGEAVLRVAVMGAPPARAEFVVERLRDAARAFLGIELPSDACIARIGPGPVGAELFDGCMDAPVQDLVGMLNTTVATPRLARVEPEAAATHVEVTEVAEPVVAKIEPPVAAIGTGQPAGARAESSCHATGPAASHAHPGSLSGFVSGLVSMAARYPHAEEIELALDDEGGLHVLGRAEAYAQRARTLERLMAAAAWAETNRKVLQLTLGDSAKTLANRPAVMHVFTDQPVSWRQLLDSPLRVHMLAAVTTHAPDWACAPVN